MKKFLLGWMALTTIAVCAQDTKPNATTVVPTTASSRVEGVVVSSAQSNRIKQGRVTCSGAAVTAIKLKNPLQWINPFAPMKAGSGEDNVHRDPISGRARGVDLVCLSR